MALPKRIAVVGGGLSGLACARRLSEAFDVSVWDMGSRGPGGRASSRVERGLSVDYGCQFVRASTPQMQSLLKEFEEAGVAAAWHARIGTLDARDGAFTAKDKATTHGLGPGFCGALLPGDLYVGVPTMGALCGFMAASAPSALTCHWAQRVVGLRRTEDQMWHVVASSGTEGAAAVPGEAGFHAVVLSDLMTLQPGSPGYLGLPAELAARFRSLQSVEKVPVFSLIALLPGSLLRLPFDAASVLGSPALSWISRDTSKPGRLCRDGAEGWVAITTPEFAAQLVREYCMLEVGGGYKFLTRDQLDAIALRLWDAFLDAVTVYIPDRNLQPIALAAQRWGSGLKTALAGKQCEFDSQSRIAVCGDFFSDCSAEGAVLSGLAAAEALESFFT